MSFRSYALRKQWLDECLKSPVSEDPSKCNMGNGIKHCCYLSHSTFGIFINHCAGSRVGQSLSFSNMQNLWTVCEQIDCRSQGFSS